MMVFYWISSDNRSPQVSRTLFNILAELNNSVIWMVSTHPPIFKSFSLCTNLSVTITSAPITIDITVTFMFHCCFLFQFSGKVLVVISLSCRQPERQSQFFDRFLLLLLLLLMIITKSGPQAEIRLSQK